MANGLILNVDTTKSEFQNPMVELRQGDGNYQSLHVTVTNNGDPVDLTDWTITFMGTTAGAHKIVDANAVVDNALQGTFNYTPTKAWGQDIGEFNKAYFKFVKSDETASGANFRVNVLEAVDLTDEEAGDYISVVDALIEQVKTDMDTKLADTQTTLTNTQNQANTVQTNVDDLNTNVNELKAQNNNLLTSNNTWSGNNTFTKPLKSIGYPRPITNNSIATIGDLIKAFISEVGESNYASISYIAYNNSFSDSPTNDGYTFLKLSTRGSSRVYIEIIDTNSNIYIGNSSNGVLKWNDFSNNFNIKSFGAKGDGVNDDTIYFKSAISQNNKIFVPSGKYIISDDIFVNNVDIVGESRESTQIIVKGDIGFLMGNGTISDVTIDITQSNPGTKAISIGSIETDNFYGGNDGKISRVYIKGSFDQPDTTGIYIRPSSSAMANTAGVWGNNIYDIIMQSIGTGINLTAGSYGFINGNAFENILIKGFYKNGVLIDSDSSNAYQNQRNYFKHVQVQANGNYALKNAVAYNIKHGQNNIFDDVTEWNDTGGIDDIVSVNFETSLGSPTIYDVINNQFISSKFEHKMTGDFKLFHLNTIKANVINFSNNKYLTGTTKNFDLLDTSRENNLLDSEIIYSEIVDSGNNGLNISGKTGTTIYSNGSAIVLSGQNSGINLTLTANQSGRVFSSKFVTISISFYSSDIASLNISNSLTIKNLSGQTTSVSATKIFATNTINGYDYHLLYDLNGVDTSLLNVNSSISEQITFSGSTNSVNVSKIKMTNYPIMAMSKYNDSFVNNHLLKLGTTMLRLNGSNVQKTIDNGTNWTNI